MKLSIQRQKLFSSIIQQEIIFFKYSLILGETSKIKCDIKFLELD